MIRLSHIDRRLYLHHNHYLLFHILLLLHYMLLERILIDILHQCHSHSYHQHRCKLLLLLGLWFCCYLCSHPLLNMFDRCNHYYKLRGLFQQNIYHYQNLNNLLVVLDSFLLYKNNLTDTNFHYQYSHHNRHLIHCKIPLKV